MTDIAIKTFRGTAPRLAPRKLEHHSAQVANDVDLWSGDLQSLKDNLQVNIPTKAGVIQTIFKLGALWLHWNEIVNVARSPVSTSNADRVYYSGHYNPKSTDEDLAQTSGTDYPTDWYRLGLPAPDTAVSVAHTGGSSTNQTRSYVYTYVTAWGEEGPPSDPSTEYTAAGDATWNLTAMDGKPLNNGTISSIVVGGGVATVTCSAAHFLETGDYVGFDSVTGTGDLPAAFNDAGYLQITRVSTTVFTVVLIPSGTFTAGNWSREAPIQLTSMAKRIYRTVSGEFRFVAELPDAATTTYDDSIADADLGEALPSAEWVSPPADLKGLITLPNGSLCGFKNNVLSFSEPFKPYAWPANYDLTFAYEIVAIAASGNSVVVATVGNPYIVTGRDPSEMTPLELEIYQACVSARSMVSVLNGAIYASPDGLVYVPVAGTPELITRSWFKEKDWAELNPSSMHCYKYDDRYYAIYTGAGPEQNINGLIVFDPAERDSTVTNLTIIADAGHSQLEEDRLYFMEDGVIKEFNEGGEHHSFTWRSKVFTLPLPVKMKAAQVKFSTGSDLLPGEIDNAITAAIGVLETDIFFPNGNPLTPDFDKASVSGAFGGYTPGSYAVGGGPYSDATKFIGDDSVHVNLRLISNQTDEKTYAVTNARPFRINVGTLSDLYEIEISGRNAIIHEILLAETMSELARQ